MLELRPVLQDRDRPSARAEGLYFRIETDPGLELRPVLQDSDRPSARAEACTSG